MTAHVVRADARTLPLPDDSVDLIVTSPPYFALRSYQDGGAHYAGQIGSEATPAEWVGALLDCTREWMRVLKPSGSLWVNLGDKYAGSGAGGGTERVTLEGTAQLSRRGGEYGRRVRGAPSKSLIGLPWRYALRCIDQLGLILRAEIIWDKPNGLPESVTDRVRRSHEQWFHFVQRPRYFSAVDEIREPHAPKSLTHRGGGQSWGNEGNPDNNWSDAKVRRPDPLGKLPSSVWEIPSEPLRVPEHLGVDHFAAFPTEWPRRIILGWSPSGICVECGEGRRPVSDVEYTRNSRGVPGGSAVAGRHRQPTWNGSRLTTITDYACACPESTAPTRPSVVADSFGGTGTTALVASVLGRTGITVDLSHDYCRLARWRTTDPGERAKAARRPKPELVPDEQLHLFAADHYPERTV